jgi:hypothetical protein
MCCTSYYFLFGKNFLLGMLMIYLHARFNMPSSNGSLVITLKLYTKGNFCNATMSFLFYKKVEYFEDLLPYITSRYYSKWSQCSTHLTSLCKHDDVIDCRNQKGAGVVSNTQCSFQVLWKLVTDLKIYSRSYTSSHPMHLHGM